MFSDIFIPSLFTLFAFALQYLRSTHRDSAKIIPQRYLESIFVHPRDALRQSSTKVLKIVDQPVEIERLIQLILKIVSFLPENGYAKLVELISMHPAADQLFMVFFSLFLMYLLMISGY